MKRYCKISAKPTEIFHNEWKECICQLNTVKQNSRIFKITLFVSDKAFDFGVKFFYEELSFFFGIELPAFSFISQPPFGHNIVLEVGYIPKDTKTQIEYKKLNNTPYVTIKDGDHKELWASGFGVFSQKNTLREEAIEAFQQVVDLLEQESLSYNNIVRQWNYIPKILNLTEVDGKNMQHYQIFNEVRKSFYNRLLTNSSYPAATGIGIEKGKVTIDIIACYDISENKVQPVNNPNQVEAYKYSQSLLIGDSLYTQKPKQAPQFERAKMTLQQNSANLYISGTAAIQGEETVGINNAEKQIKVTLDLIQSLINQATFDNKYNIPPIITRVYIKREEDFETIKNICDKYWKSSTVIYSKTDVCRDNLLVEVETEIQATEKNY